MRISPSGGASLIRMLVARNEPHRNYQRNTERAKFWHSIWSGLDQMEIVVSYKPRESDEQKKQRFRLFNSPTPEAAARAMGNYSRLESSDEPIRTIKYEGVNNDNEAVLKSLISRFNGDRDLPRFLLDTEKKYLQIDPNAFLVILFDGERDATGAFKAKPVPRPEIVESDQVYDFLLDNGSYHWLCRRQYIDGKASDNRSGKWQRFVLYTADYVFEAIEVNEFNDIAKIQERIGSREYDTFQVKQGNKDVQFALVTYPISSKEQLLSADYEMPFAPLGYEDGPDTGIYDSILAPAESRFRDLINRTSEYALTIALHTFLQKYQYIQKCDYVSKAGRCSDGKIDPSGTSCPQCKGTGHKIIATVQDTVTITLPETRDEFFPISEMVQYIELPFQIVEHLKAEIESLESKIEAAIWGIDLRKSPDGKMTATEVISRYDTVYVRLSRIEKHIAGLWEKCVRLTAKYAEIDNGLQVSYSPRKNYQMETLGELMAAFTEAKTGGAPYQVIRTLELSIIKKQGKASDVDLMWNDAMERFRPFKTKTESQIALILSGVPEDDYYRVLWAYFDEIFEQIKNEIPDFYILPYSGSEKSQVNTLSAYVNKFQELVRAQQQSVMSSQQALINQN